MRKSKQYRDKLYEAVELGRMGGLATKKKDPEHFKRISKLGHEAKARKKALDGASKTL